MNMEEEKRTIIIEVSKEDIKPKEFGKLENDGASDKDEEMENGFCRILLKTPFEECTKNIYDDLLLIKFGDVKIEKEEKRKYSLELYRSLKEIAESLLTCKTARSIEIRGILKAKLPSDIKIKLESELEKQYKEHDLNFEDMTFEEGENILKNHLCDDVYEAIGDYWREYADEMDLGEEERAGGYSYDNIDDDIVYYYIEGKRVEKKITPAQIKRQLKWINEAIKANTRHGAPPKNIKLNCAARVFMELDKYRPSSKIYRIMFACLDYMGFIDDEQKKRWGKDKRYQPEIAFIKSVCKESKKMNYPKLKEKNKFYLE